MRNIKIEIELHEGDFKYKDVEIWAYGGDGTYYMLPKSNVKFVNLIDAIRHIDENIGDKND